VTVPSHAGFVQVILALLDRGGVVREVDSHGWRPLRHAAFYGHAEAVACLLGRGARAADLGPLGSFAFSSAVPLEQIGRVTKLLNAALESETAEYARVVQLAQTAQPSEQTHYSELGSNNEGEDGVPVGISADEAYGDEGAYTTRSDTPRQTSPGTGNQPTPLSPPPDRAPPPPPPGMAMPYRPSRVSTLYENSPGPFVSPLPEGSLPGREVSGMSTYQPSPMASYDLDRPTGPTSSYSSLSGAHDPSIGTSEHRAELGS
jgi:hypothetical protein